MGGRVGQEWIWRFLVEHQSVGDCSQSLACCKNRRYLPYILVNRHWVWPNSFIHPAIHSFINSQTPQFETQKWKTAKIWSFTDYNWKSNAASNVQMHYKMSQIYRCTTKCRLICDTYLTRLIFLINKTSVHDHNYYLNPWLIIQKTFFRTNSGVSKKGVVC